LTSFSNVLSLIKISNQMPWLQIDDLAA